MDDDIQRLSGSMAITGAADLIMQLKKERGKTSAELSVEGRDIEYQNLLIDFDGDTFEWINQGDYSQAKCFLKCAISPFLITTYSRRT